MLYSVLFEPIYKELLWGGSRLNDIYGRKSPFICTGESWDISCRPAEMGIVKNGVYQGLSFQDLIDKDRAGWLGAKQAGRKDFPLLVKLIDANDNLSIQVYPDNAFAGAGEEVPFEKNELWYILEAPIGSVIAFGLKDGVTKEAFKQAVEDDRVEACLNELSVEKGDMLYIPAGLVHGISKGIMVAEIQQNSDLTYRVYDYNRVGPSGKTRELHVEKALAVMDFDNKIKKERLTGLPLRKEGAEITSYLELDGFAVMKYKLRGRLAEETDGLAFSIFTCVDGEGRLTGTWGETLLPVGASALAPAGLGAYTLEGNAILLKSWPV